MRHIGAPLACSSVLSRPSGTATASEAPCCIRSRESWQALRPPMIHMDASRGWALSAIGGTSRTLQVPRGDATFRREFALVNAEISTKFCS